MSYIDVYEDSYSSGPTGASPIEAFSPDHSFRDGEEMDAVAKIVNMLADMDNDDVLVIHRVIN